MDLTSEIAQQLYDGDADGVASRVEQALAQGLDPRQVLQQGLLAGMGRVGQDFQAGELFVPELIVAARAMHAGLDRLRPHLSSGDVEPSAESNLARSAPHPGGAPPLRAHVVIGTVQGDLHDIGKRLVGIMMQGVGLRVVDLGHDVAPGRFVEAARNEGAALVGLSALLSTTMPMMRATIEALRQAGLPVRTLVGGAPVTRRWADEIGADGYAPDAVAAAALARELLR